MDNPFFEIIEKLNEILLKLSASDLGTPKGENEKPITTLELCEFLGVTEPTIIRYRKKGKIPFFQIGSSVRYNKTKVIDALEMESYKKNGNKSNYNLYKKDIVENLDDPYIVSKLKRQGFVTEMIKNDTELLELKRKQLKIKREITKIKKDA